MRTGWVKQEFLRPRSEVQSRLGTRQVGGLASRLVQAVLRYLAILNAAVWLGATVFFTLGAGPAIFGPEVAVFLPKPYRARVAEIVITRLFVVQQICGGFALALLLAECLKAGRWVRRVHLGVVAGLLLAALLAGFWLAPRMHRLQEIRYAPQASPVEQTAAARAFGAWHGFSQVINLAVLAGLLFHLWAVSRPPETPKLANTFRGVPPVDGTVPRML